MIYWLLTTRCLEEMDPLSHIIFTHTSFGRLARQDGTRAHWIYLDLTGNRPYEGPGDQIYIF